MVTTRWGILGTGFAARHFAASLRRVKGAAITRVASRDPARAAAFAADFGGKATRNYDELLVAADVDVIYIATPTALHGEHALACLEADKAVLCEKPLATSAAEAERVIEVARGRRRFLMEAVWTRFLPLMCHVRARVRAGEIGPLSLLQADLAVPVADDPNDPRTAPGAGAGALLDLGVYPVSLALDLLGAPQRVHSHVLCNEQGVDRQAVLTLAYPDASAVLTTSFNGGGRNDATLIGARGRMHLSAPLYAPEVLTTTTWPRPQAGEASGRGPRRIDRVLERVHWLGPVYRAALPMLRVAAGRDRKTLRPFAGFGYQFEAEEVGRQLSTRQLESPTMSWEDSLALARVLDSARAVRML